MCRHLALLAMTAALACGSGRSTDPPAGARSFAPRLSGSGDRVVLSWVEPAAAGGPALRYSRRDRGAWTEARSVIADPALAADGADVPSVVPLGGGGLVAHWTIKRGASAQARNLLVSVSRDDGVSWSAPVRPHRDDTDSEHAMATLLPAASGDGFGMCWLDGRAAALAEYGEAGTSLYWANWNGDGFEPEVLLDPRVCDCCKTSAARTTAGPIVAYRDRGDGEGERRDIATVHRDAAGWSSPVPVHDDGWTLSACPTNGPSVAAEGGSVAIAWFTGANAMPSVWTARSEDGGRTLLAPVRVDDGAPVGRVEATMLPDGSTAIVWLERKGSEAEIRVRRVTPEGKPMPSVAVARTSPSRASGYPTLTAAGARDVLVAWTKTGPEGRVRSVVATLP